MKKVRAIWGAGFLGGKELLVLGKENIDFFIDANPQKKGTFFSSKPVIYFDDINNWEELYLYIPSTYILSIEPVLKFHNLTVNEDYELFDGKYPFSYEKMEQDYNRAIEDVNDKIDKIKGKVLFWGWDFSEKRNYNEYFKKVKEKNNSFEYAVIAENLWSDIEEVERKNGASTIMAPNVFCYEGYLTSLCNNKPCHKEIDEIIYKSAEQLMLFCPEITKECAVLQVEFMLKYIEYILEFVRPQYIFASDARNVRSALLRYACKGKNILIYASTGILPRTYTLDPYGETGNCIPNLDIQKFRNSYITDEEWLDAKNLIAELRESGENRKLQQEFDLSLLNFNNKERPIILFAAQPDTDFTPYDEEVQTHYSPVFKTSREAGVYISELCKKNDWNYIFKSHPVYIQEGIEKELHGDALYIEQGNINTLIDNVDVVITIQSSVSYTSMIRNKPTVMLGYNQMREKGCCYEAYKLNEIEGRIKDALQNKVTQKMAWNFVLHIAQLKKYYLYDDLSPKKTMRGKPIFGDIKEIFG